MQSKTWTDGWRSILYATSLLLVASAVALGGESNEGEALSADEKAYRKAILERSSKIVDKLGFDDAAQKGRVVGIVAQQYRQLRDIHDRRDAELEGLEDLEDVDLKRRLAKAEADAAVVAAHREFIARLGAELDPGQVEQIKDGMTYGVAPLTYDAYLALLPDLADDEKRQIKAWLFEAREHAMDGGSSDEKHAWFGKYKGKINNYLSARGYNLKRAEQERAERRRANAAP